MKQHSGHDRSIEDARRLKDGFGKGVAISLSLHVLLLAAAVVLPGVFPAMGDSLWGDPNASGGIHIGLATDVGGIPLPQPEVINETAAGNDSEGFFDSEPPPPAPAPEPEAPVVEAEPIPERPSEAEAAPPEPPPSPSPPAPEPEPEAPPAATPPAPSRDSRNDDRTADRPDNAVPFGDGGQVAIPRGLPGTGDGTGLSFGDGAFGDRYGRYVETIVRRISENWIQGTIPSSVRTAPRVWVTFDIERNGDIRNMKIETSSGIDSVDRSALRAVSATGNLGALPRDYRGARVTVRFWFDLRR